MSLWNGFSVGRGEHKTWHQRSWANDSRWQRVSSQRRWHPPSWVYRTMNRTLRSNISLWDIQMVDQQSQSCGQHHPYLNRYRDPLLPQGSSSVSPDYTTWGSDVPCTPAQDKCSSFLCGTNCEQSLDLLAQPRQPLPMPDYQMKYKTSS